MLFPLISAFKRPFFQYPGQQPLGRQQGYGRAAYGRYAQALQALVAAEGQAAEARQRGSGADGVDL